MALKIKTGIKSLDMLTGGLSIGTVNLVVGNSCSGKTTLLSKIATNVVDDDNNYHTVMFNSQKSEIVDFNRVKLNRSSNVIHTVKHILVDTVKLINIKNISPVLVIFDDLYELTELDFAALKEFASNIGCIVLLSTVSPVYTEMCDTVLYTSFENTLLHNLLKVRVSVHSCPLVNDSLIEHVI